MSKRRVFVIFVGFVLAVCMSALWAAEGDEREGDTATNVVAASGAEAGAADATPEPKKKGSRFARFFKAPFKAVGKIFGGGGGEGGRVARMTEADAARFESVGVVRVEDGGRRRPEVTGTEGSARDHLERGRALLQSGDLNEAIAELSRAASLDARW